MFGPDPDPNDQTGSESEYSDRFRIRNPAENHCVVSLTSQRSGLKFAKWISNKMFQILCVQTLNNETKHDTHITWDREIDQIQNKIGELQWWGKGGINYT